LDLQTYPLSSIQR